MNEHENKMLNPDIAIVEWHKWFAWYPVKTKEGKWRFRECVERRIHTVGTGYTPEDIHVFREYRLLPGPGKVEPYLDEAIESFLNDPPDSPYQKGYLAALLDVWKEALGLPDNEIVTAVKDVS